MSFASPTPSPKQPRALDADAIIQEYTVTLMGIRQLVRTEAHASFVRASAQLDQLITLRKTFNKNDISSTQALLNALWDTNFALRPLLLSKDPDRAENQHINDQLAKLEAFAAEINIGRNQIRELVMDTLRNSDPLKAAQTAVAQAMEIPGLNVPARMINSYTDTDNNISVAFELNGKPFTIVLCTNKAGNQVIKTIHLTTDINNRVPTAARAALGYSLAAVGESLARTLAFDLGDEPAKEPQPSFAQRATSLFQRAASGISNWWNKKPAEESAPRPSRPMMALRQKSWFTPPRLAGMIALTSLLTGRTPNDAAAHKPEYNKPTMVTTTPRTQARVAVAQPAPETRSEVESLAINNNPEATLITFLTQINTINGAQIDANATAWRLNQKLMAARDRANPHAHTHKGDRLEIERAGSHIGMRIVRANGTVVCDTGPLSLRTLLVTK
ncbi:hypothetical protein KA517_00695 [Candidatus Gracilibacteria bacterium]|nr:hypothetical protein [Candidatus Gracilibacteria bacterium]